MYLLDTCAISDFVRGHKNTVARMSVIPAIKFYISYVNIFEVEFGLAKNPQRALKTMPILIKLFSRSELIHFGLFESVRAAHIRHELESVGNTIGPYDIQIAATALVHNLTLVTSNVTEFSRIKGLKYENWRVAEEMVVV